MITFFSSRLLQAGAELSVERVLEIIKQGVVALPKDRLKVRLGEETYCCITCCKYWCLSGLYSESYHLPSTCTGKGSLNLRCLLYCILTHRTVVKDSDSLLEELAKGLSSHHCIAYE